MIPPLADLPAPPKRIILHWTGGGHQPNPVDLGSYHFVIDRQGKPHAGAKVKGNMRTIPPGTPTDEYAAHCAGMNSFSVGISFAAMAGAVRGGSSGPAPLLEAQFEAGLDFVARCCREWGLSPDDPRQLLTHAEVERVYRVKQANKWDIAVLPWNGAQGAEEIGNLIRAGVASRLAEMEREADPADEPGFPAPEETRGAEAQSELDREPEPAGASAPPSVSTTVAVADPSATFWRRMIRIFRGGA
jgi:hypothetical protein